MATYLLLIYGDESVCGHELARPGAAWTLRADGRGRVAGLLREASAPHSCVEVRPVEAG